MHQTEEEFNETDEQKKTFLQKLSDAKDALKYMFYHVNKNYGDPYFDYKTSSGKTIKCPNLRAHMICGFSCPDWITIFIAYLLVWIMVGVFTFGCLYAGSKIGNWDLFPTKPYNPIP